MIQPPFSLIFTPRYRCNFGARTIKYKALIILWWIFLKFHSDLRVLSYLITLLKVAFRWVDPLVEISQALVVQPVLELSLPIPLIFKSTQAQILEIWIKNIRVSKFTMLTLLMNRGSFGVSKTMNKPQKNWCVAQEQCFQHLNLPQWALIMVLAYGSTHEDFCV